MAFLSHNHIPISSLIILLILLLIPPPPWLSSNSEPVLDSDSKSFIQTICNGTRDPGTCDSVFAHNLPNSDSDPEGLTNVAIDQALERLYEHIAFIEEEKGRICDKGSVNWGVLTACEESYLEVKNVFEESKMTFVSRNLKSMVKFGELFVNIRVNADDEIGKCESAVNNKGFGSNLLGFDLMQRNKNMGLLIEIVVVAGEKLVTVMDVGVEEDIESRFGFMKFFFHG